MRNSSALKVVGALRPRIVFFLFEFLSVVKEEQQSAETGANDRKAIAPRLSDSEEKSASVLLKVLPAVSWAHFSTLTFLTMGQ